MADINVKQLSKAIKIDLDNLLTQMKAAGLSHKSEKDIVSTEDKKVLLKFIKDSKKDSKKTISLSNSSQKTAKPNLSVTRINSPDKEKKSNVKQDFTGAIDFDEAEEETKEARKLELSDGFSEEELELLVKNEILSVENLADLATDELTEIFEIDEERAAKLIMSAREEWLED